MLQIQKGITPHNHYDGGNTKKYIVIHDVGALGQAKANINYFQGENRGASCHYFVDTTSIWQSVEDNDRAWHVGDDKGNDGHDIGDLINNHNSIGIEMCLNPNWKVEEKTKRHTIDLVKHLQKKHNIPNNRVVRHYDASGKNCPGSMAGNNWSEWKDLYKRITGSVATNPTIAVNNKTKHVVKTGDTLWGISKQYNVTVAQLKEWNNLKSDLIVVGETLTLAKGKKQSTSNPTPVVSTPSSINKGDKVTAKTLYATGDSTKNTRTTSITGYVDTVNHNWKNEVRLKNSNGAYIGFTRLSDIGTIANVTIKKYNLPNTEYWVKKPQFGGSGVREVQRALASIYFYPNKGATNNGVDGWYGQNTADAVKRFQLMYGLKADGIYGDSTRKKLDASVN